MVDVFIIGPKELSVGIMFLQSEVGITLLCSRIKNTDFL